MTLNDVRVINVAEDLDFTADLRSDGVLVVTVYYLEREHAGRRRVDDSPDRAAAAAADSVSFLELSRVDELVPVLVVVLSLVLLLLVGVVVLVARRLTGGRGRV